MFDFGPSVFHHAGSNSAVHTLISSAFLGKKTLKISQTGEIHWRRIPHIMKPLHVNKGLMKIAYERS